MYIKRRKALPSYTIDTLPIPRSADADLDISDRSVVLGHLVHSRFDGFFLSVEGVLCVGDEFVFFELSYDIRPH